MIERSGSIPLAYGSGSRRPKNIRIRRIRIGKTGFHSLNFEATAFSALGAWCLIWRPSCMPSLGTPSTWRRTTNQLPWRTASRLSRLSMDGKPSWDGRLAVWWSSDSCLHTAHLFAQETNFFRCSNKNFWRYGFPCNFFIGLVNSLFFYDLNGYWYRYLLRGVGELLLYEWTSLGLFRIPIDCSKIPALSPNF